MIRILHVVPALDGGGVENLLLNYYTNMDRVKFRFDFIVYGQEKGALESTFEKLGSTIYHIEPRHKALFYSLKQMKKIIYSNKYDIVHAHQNRMSFIPLFYAKRCGVRTRVAHSHMAYETENIIKKIERKLFSALIRYYATDWLACGIEAGRWLYGKKAIVNGKVRVMNNAIYIDKFTFNENTRLNIRSELGIENKFVVGNVGRLSPEKNHKFLIQIFSEIHKINSNAVLLIAGGGVMEESIKEQVHYLGLDDCVSFLGVCKNIPKLMQAMDVFLLPTMFEGFGIAYLEAQAAGLVCFGTDKVVPREVGVTENMHFISIDKSSRYWANEALKYSEKYTRKVYNKEIRNKGYDILQQAKRLEVFYEQRV